MKVICSRLVAFLFFGYFLALGCCPTWFVAFLLATNLLELAGYLVLRQPEGGPALLQPLPPSRGNTVAHFVWIGVVLADIYLRAHFPRHFIFSNAFYLAGYGTLAALEGVRFFRSFRGDLLARSLRFRA